ncbi:hypothetical protein BMS_1932 [Halobacteriovorax marinus SJ]|uniref:WSN domain-containing protein n=1 Tax=Halobacteriovorax marinus (strain ATCC BAA-682 / DSM 15412 / SJ) TaxID=862908 RepID=E1X2I1_HALMS|nr:hypothetical protein [Halobacteriovorax marinus]CBW26748.1 hypothetical protein BMS_1932 [Halobacteriovorax marinus SJ]
MNRSIVSLFLLLSLTPSQVMGSSDLSTSINALDKAKVDPSIVKKIEELKERNLTLKTRPVFCPLNSSRSDVILNSIKNIEAIFKDDCLDGSQGTLDQVLTGAREIQDSINQSREARGEDPITVPETDGLANTGISGEQMASLVNGLNTLFNKNKCSHLDDSSFLENSANVIQNFSQFGLYSPSPAGVSVAYGGLVVSSILKFINNLFEGRFDFKKDEDRLTFIKLNCSFYDVRIKMQEAGILDISTDAHYKDLAKIEELIVILKKLQVDIKTSTSTINAQLESIRKSHVDAIGKERLKFFIPILDILEPLNSSSEVPVSAQRDIILDKLTFNYNLINSYVSDFINPTNGQRVSRQNRSLRDLLESIDEISHLDKVVELENLSDSAFNLYTKNLKYHFKRLLNEIDSQRSDASKELADVIINIEGREDLTFSKLDTLSKSGNGVKTNSQIDALLLELNQLKSKLLSITGKKEFTSENGADGADLRILEAHDKVINYIYGDYGKDFVDHMRKKSAKVNKLFIKDFKKFASSNLDERGGYYHIKNIDDLTSDQVDKACVSAKNLRATWKYAQKWAEMGYDFLATNKDIFGETGSYVSNDRDKIFNNSQSAIFARRIISALKLQKKNQLEGSNEKVTVEWQGKTLSVAAAIDLLKDDYNYTLGESMLDIQMTRDHNGLLQSLYGQYRCDLRANYEK